jgi:hypothetical protein
MAVATESWVDTTLTIGKQEISIKEGFFRQAELMFYPENPRIYSIISGDGYKPTQKDIEQKLGEMEHVKKLVQSIRENGGLTDPIIVRDQDYVVLEGNSRLAAYRILSRNNPIQWGKIKVKLLPADISDVLVFALLGQYHIIGRKDWAPYEQAGYLYRRHKNLGADPTDIAKEMGLSVKMINHLIHVYEFMVKHKDTDITRWSYYDEYLKSRTIRKAREGNPEMDKIVVKKIKSKEIEKAVDVREKLSIIAHAGKNILSDFLEKEDSIERAYERASAKGVDNVWYKRLHKFREFLLSEEAKHDFSDMDEVHKKKCEFELKKIKTAIDLVLNRKK